MSGIEIELNSVVLLFFFIEAESFTIAVKSISNLFHCVRLISFLDSQFIIMVFMAMVNAVRRTVMLSLVMLISDVSPSKQSDKESVMV